MDTDHFFDRAVTALRPLCRRTEACAVTIYDIRTDTYSAGVGPGYRADIRYSCL